MLKNISSKNGKALIGIAFSFLLSNASLEAAKVRHGCWTSGKDQRLIEAVAAFIAAKAAKAAAIAVAAVAVAQPRTGGDWEEVAALVPGKTGQQCRDRWNDYLDPAINNGSWTEDEDKKLMTIFQEVGRRWGEIARRLSTNRTDQQCRCRFESLTARQQRTAARLSAPSSAPAVVQAEVPAGGNRAAATGAAGPANPFLVRLPSSRLAPPAPVVVQAGVPAGGDGYGDWDLAYEDDFANPPPGRLFF